MTKKLKTFVAFIALGAAAMPAAFAQTPAVNWVCSPSSLQGIVSCLSSFQNLLDTIFWVIAIIFVFYAAFLYLTAAGSDDQLVKAKKTLIYAIVAMVVAILATSIRSFLTSVL